MVGWFANAMETAVAHQRNAEAAWATRPLGLSLG